MPISNGNQKRAGLGELGAAIGVASEEFAIPRKHRLRRGHFPDDDLRQFRLALVFVSANALKTADTRKEFTDIMPPAPFAVADDINPGLLLEADGENHQIVHHFLVSLRRYLAAPSQQVLHNLGTRQRTDHLRDDK